MQLSFITLVQLSETIRDAEFVSWQDSPDSQRVYIMVYGGQRIFAIHGKGDWIVVIEPSLDGEPSIHEQAAEMLGDMRRPA